MKKKFYIYTAGAALCTLLFCISMFQVISHYASAGNRKFGRWVKRDSKGIAVIDKNAETMRLKHYFDISDTQEGRYRRLVRPVPLWEVGEQYRQDVQETLANAFGVSGEMLDFAGTILEAAGNAADDNIADYLKDILDYRKDSFFRFDLSETMRKGHSFQSSICNTAAASGRCTWTKSCSSKGRR